MRSFLAVLLVLSASSAHGASDLKELIVEVNPNKALRLMEYNGTFLEQELYFSKRHRIVKADTKLLLSGDEFLITPFENVGPFQVKHEVLQRLPDMVHILGYIIPSDLSNYDDFDRNPSFLFSLYAYDLEDSDTAHLSISNRFRHSPHWTFDESGSPVLENPPNGVAAVAGAPPQTEDDIAWHKKIKKLRKHQFFSVGANFTSPDGRRFILAPLKYTPKYSVIHELDPDMQIRSNFDNFPGLPNPQSEEEALKARDYATFKSKLADETGKAIKGDIN
jgi:hypothetical protein